MSENQHGFGNNISASLVLIEWTEEITTTIEKRKCMLGVFIDLKKTFDTIEHDILLSKLCAYGIRGTLHKWLSSSLNNRRQYVQYAGSKSESMKVNCGVLQGWVLGPKLFLLYIRNIWEESKILQFVLFADDTIFFFFWT